MRALIAMLMGKRCRERLERGLDEPVMGCYGRCVLDADHEGMHELEVGAQWVTRWGNRR